MKKVLITALLYDPFVGGAEIALREVTKRLRHKYNFTILTARMRRNLKKRDIVEGIKVVRLGFGIRKIDPVIFPLLALLYSIPRKFDSVYALLANQAALAGRMISFVKLIPLTINLQSGDTEKYIKGQLGFLYFLYNLAYSKRAKYTVLSRFLRKRAIDHKIPKENITIIPNGVDTKKFHCASETRTGTVIITTSRLVLKNAIDDVIKAMPLVKKEVESAKFIICGSGSDEQKLKSLVKKLNLANSIEFKGTIKYEELKSYLCTSDVFVRPSISEGFGNSFVEALSCGLPIVGTPVGGIIDFLEHEKTGLMCKVNNPTDLAKQIVRLLKDKKLSSKIVKNGKELISKRYDWDIIAQKYNKEVFAK